MALEVMINRDADYERWLAEHPRGVVLNANQRPKRTYVNAHRASCPHISRLPRGYTTWTAGAYLKVVADRIDELDDWCLRRVGVRAARRCTCWNR